jgi:hypothetical protein
MNKGEDPVPRLCFQLFANNSLVSGVVAGFSLNLTDAPGYQ